jgi:hypothetical protein
MLSFIVISEQFGNESLTLKFSMLTEESTVTAGGGTLECRLPQLSDVQVNSFCIQLMKIAVLTGGRCIVCFYRNRFSLKTSIPFAKYWWYLVMIGVNFSH